MQYCKGCPTPARPDERKHPMYTEQEANTFGSISLLPRLDVPRLIIRPGESVWVSCIADGSESYPAALIVQTLPGDDSPLILHPAVIPSGERIRVRLSNPSKRVCVIADNDCADSCPRHGIFRNAAVLPTSRPIARASRLADYLKGVCAS